MLWQDEAETAILAETALKGGYPNGILDRKVIFTGRLKEKECMSDCTFLEPEKYEFSQVDYGDNGELRYGPLSIIYLVSGSYFLLGISTFTTRLFPVLVSIFSLLFLYKLGSLFYNHKVGLIAMLIHAINPIMINYERFAEYDSLNLFAFLSTVYFVYLLLVSEKSKYVLLSVISLTLLVYTNPIIALPIIILTSMYVFHKHLFLKEDSIYVLVKVFIIVLILCIPFLIFLLKFTSVNSIVYPIYVYHERFFLKLPNIFFISILTTGGYLSLAGLILSFSSVKKTVLNIVFFSAFLCDLLFIPPAHFFDRAIIIVIPFFAIYSAYALSTVLNQKRQFIKRCSIIFLIIIMFFPFMLSYPFLPLNDYEFNFFRTTYNTAYSESPLYQYTTAMLTDTIEPIKNKLPWQQTAWVKDAIQFFNEKSVGDEDIFVTYNNLVFNYYTNLNVELIWPIREKFLEELGSRFWIVVEPDSKQLEEVCTWFYYELDPYKRCSFKNYDNRVKSCMKTILGSNTVIYECNHREDSEI